MIAAPLTGPWTLATGTAALSNSNTASPTWGNGSLDNADASSIYSPFTPVALNNPGDKVVLTGSVQMFGITPLTAGGAFRFGLFNVNASVTTSNWLGYFVRLGNGSSSGPLNERANPNSGHFTSNVGSATIGSAAAPGVNLDDSTYLFSFMIERNSSSGLLITTSLRRTTDAVEFVGLNVLDISPQTFVFDRAGLQATTDLNADQLQLLNVDVAFVPAVLNLVITNSALVGGVFQVSADNLVPTKSYVLTRSGDLFSFPDAVDSFTGGATHTFIDPSPPAGKAFYRIEVVQ